MRLRPLSRSVAATLAASAPLLLLCGSKALALEPGSDVDCTVGTAAYPTIQSAVDAAACTTIGVPAGTFFEGVAIGRSVAIRGAGPERTIVDATGKFRPVFAIASPQPRQPCDPPGYVVTLTGLTITGGTGPDAPAVQRNGGGVAAAPGVKLTVENSIVTGNSAYMNGGGISVANGRLTIVNSVITRNTAFGNSNTTPTPPNFVGGGGGVRIAGCPSVLIVKNSVIRDNVSHRHGGGILSYVSTPIGIVPGVSIPGPDGTMILINSEIMRNTAAEPFGGGGVYAFRTDLTEFNGQIKHNAPEDLKAAP